MQITIRVDISPSEKDIAPCECDSVSVTLGGLTKTVKVEPAEVPEVKAEETEEK